MWKKLQDTQYYILFTEDFVHEICVTDYVNIWSTIFSEKKFLTQLKDSNFGLELDNDGQEHENDKKFIQKGLQLLSNPEKLKKVAISLENNSKTLNLKLTMWFGYNFCFECKLSKGSEELFFHKVTHTLLKTIKDLRSSENELRRLLIKKDEEIEEYKCEGGEIVLRHLKTVAFNNEEHLKKFRLYERNFGSFDVPTDILKKGDDMPKISNIKQEHVADKTNPVPVVKPEPVVNFNINPDPVVKAEPSSQPNEYPVTPIPPLQSPVKCEPGVKREMANGRHNKKRKKFNI